MKIANIPYPVAIHFKMTSKMPSDEYMGFCTRAGSKITIAVRQLKDNKDISILVHEIVHCIDFIEEFVESDFDSETRAYLTQNILVQILDKYNSNMKERKCICKKTRKPTTQT